MYNMYCVFTCMYYLILCVIIRTCIPYMYDIYRELSTIVVASSPVPTNMSKTALNVPLVGSVLTTPPPPLLLLLPQHHLVYQPPPHTLSHALARLRWTSITSPKLMLLTSRTPPPLREKPC